MKKLILLVIIAIVVYGFFALGINERLSIDGLKSSLSQVTAFKDEDPIRFAAIFFASYVIIAALSLPGAAIMTLAAGALFGLIEGVLITSFASSIGATLAFWTSRFLLRDTIKSRFGTNLKAFEDGINKDGAFYLFSLRLVPIFPFFLINLVMGLTPIKSATFYLISQIGMLAGSIIYVNAGTQLSSLTSLSSIASPNILISLALLGIFPWIAKAVMAMIKHNRLYAKYKKPVKFDRNLIVIGAGAAGLVSSYIAAAVKAKVTLVEGHKMGGDCLNYGCVPSKALIKSAKIAYLAQHADNYGLENSQPQFSFKKIMARIHHVIADIAPHDSIERYTGLGVEVLSGQAKIVDPWTVEITQVDGAKLSLSTRTIIIATGAAPFVPPLPGIDDIGYLTSDTLWDEFAKRDHAPKRLVILGGGPIGCELSQSFARLGSQVTQVEMADRLLIREDQDVSDFAKSALQKSGVSVLTSHKALGFEREGDKKFILLEHKGVKSRLEFDDLICCVGRSARLSGYGLEDLGITVGRTLNTDDFMQTNYPNILAAGDVTGPYQFTHVAAHQAWYASVNALFGNLKKFKADYRVIPWTTFIDPEIARVGLNEQEAKSQKIAYEITRYDIDDLDRAICDGDAHGFVKVLTIPGKDTILGVTILGASAGELLTEFVLAMKWGLGLNKILGTIHTYPTLAEANKYAAGAWKRAHVSKFTLGVLSQFHKLRRG